MNILKKGVSVWEYLYQSIMSSSRASFINLTDLLEETDKLTDWYTLGVWLKMPSEDLKDIENRYASTAGLKRCKIELFTLWLQRNPNASWDQIAQALEKCDQIAMADRIRDRKTAKCHLPPTVPATASMPPSPEQPTGQPVQLQIPKDKVIQFRKLESCYAQLASNLKISLDEKQVPLVNIRRFLEELLDEDDRLSQANSIDELFHLIRPHYCFLNTSILGDIIKRFIGEPLKHELEEYERQLEEFKESTSMALLEELGPQYSPSVEAPQVTIKLTRCYQPVTIKRFQKLVEQIFEENSTALANISVKKGCISVTWLARRSAIPSLIAQAQDKTQFMRLVGVLRVSVAGIDILEQEEEEDTFLSSALVHAGSVDSVDAVDMLLSLEADPNSSDSKGITPLMIACRRGNIRIATLLLQAHANINQQSKNGATALMVACYSEMPQYELVKLLVQSGADINMKTSEQQWTALMIAAERSRTSFVQYLLDEGAPVNTKSVNGNTALMLASELGHSEVVHLLINYGADLNILAKGHDMTALMYACGRQRTVCVDLLLASGADPNLCGEEHSPLIEACIIDDDCPMDPTIIEKLLSAGANPNTQTEENGNTALMEAAIHGYEKGIEVLLKAKADVNIQNSNGLVALHYAAERGHLAVCKMLLASGARVSVTNKFGDTPLELALNKGHQKVCELLHSSMDSDPSHTTQETVTTQPSHTAQEINKPVQNGSQSHKTRSKKIPPIKLRRGILPSIASVGRLFRNLFLPDREIKLRHSNQTQEPNITNNN